MTARARRPAGHTHGHGQRDGHGRSAARISAVTAGLLLAVAVAGCSGAGRQGGGIGERGLVGGAAASPASAATGGFAAGGPCTPRVAYRVLPVWARAGFSGPRPRANYALGRRGTIAAILFKDPLLSPPSPTVSNKILWVPRVPVRAYSPLVIQAQRMAGDRPVGAVVRREVPGGPGPSIINLPAAGCWRLSLRWSGHTDSVDLRYRAGRGT